MQVTVCFSFALCIALLRDVNWRVQVAGASFLGLPQPSGIWPRKLAGRGAVTSPLAPVPCRVQKAGQQTPLSCLSALRVQPTSSSGARIADSLASPVICPVKTGVGVASKSVYLTRILLRASFGGILTISRRSRIIDQGANAKTNMSRLKNARSFPLGDGVRARPRLTCQLRN